MPFQQRQAGSLTAQDFGQTITIPAAAKEDPTEVVRGKLVGVSHHGRAARDTAVETELTIDVLDHDLDLTVKSSTVVDLG